MTKRNILYLKWYKNEFVEKHVYGLGYKLGSQTLDHLTKDKRRKIDIQLQKLINFEHKFKLKFTFTRDMVQSMRDVIKESTNE